MIRMALIFVAVLAWTPSISFAQAHCSNLEFGRPGNSDQILCRDGYTVGYSYAFKIPMWCAYWLTKESIDGTNVKRASSFHVDAEVPQQFRSGSGDYSHSGYDRGHCAPSASIDFSRHANDQTFLYSNMIPQLPGFNRDMMGYRGVWGYLENEVRGWVRGRGKLYVVSGSIVGRDHKSIGDGVAIPSAFYKVILDPSSGESIAFLMPHKPNSRDKAGSYITSIDNIEAVAGIDLFPLIRDDQEDALESKAAGSLW